MKYTKTYSIFHVFYREDYVSYLENYIKVDIYGSCGNLECTPEEVSNYGLFQINPVSVKYPGFYIESTLNINLILWHVQLIVCAENVKSWFKSWVFPFTFQAYILPHTLNCMCVSLFKFHI